MFLLFHKGKLTDLKLVIEDTIDNVATLQDCSSDQGESLQLGKIEIVVYRHIIYLEIFLHLYFLLELSEIFTGVQRGRTVQGEATIQDLRSMLSEMQELLHKQVTCSVSRSYLLIKGKTHKIRH